MGGYSGVEGQEGTSAINTVELLALSGQDWCQLHMQPAVVSLEGSTMDWVSMFDFLESSVGNGNYSSPHSSLVWERVLVCGGVDQAQTQTIQLSKLPRIRNRKLGQDCQ